MIKTTEYYLNLNTSPRPVPPPTPWYGWFSLTAKRSGAQAWLAKNEAGNKVIFTSKTLSPDGPEYRWDDRVALGLLTSTLKQISGPKSKYIQE